ncbi:hypothetical protein [Pseudoroseicyclus sp. CXY001]|uniref:hypothetical protein n=1 Tax=Pseudoroseicyclus sp. CXY001 TaxID=3242492 RepID=UPI0035713E99
MTPLQIALMAALGLVFLLWTVTMFQWVFRLRALAVEQTGQLWPGPFAVGRALAAWADDPAERGLKMRLVGLTLLLFALIAVGGLLARA